VRYNFGSASTEYHRPTRPRQYQLSRAGWRLARQAVPASAQRQRVGEWRASGGGARELRQRHSGVQLNPSSGIDPRLACPVR